MGIMKLDFGKVIVGLDGKPIKFNDRDATLGLIAVEALCAAYPDEQNLTGEEKYKRAVLAEMAYKCNGEDVSVEDVTLIKKLIGKAYAPLVVKKAYDIIEGK
jgi:hypothetical protein